MTQGDFKVGGITYSDVGAPQDLLLTFGYTETDGDSIGGSFNAIVNTTQTSLDLTSALTSYHIDHLIKPDTV